MRTLFSTFAFLLYACLWMIAAPRASAQAPDQSTGVHMIGGDALMEWMGYGGRTYFIQVSGDLKGWTWAPLIEHGAGDFISYEFGGTEPRGFARLQYTDAEPPDGVSLEDWDADGDGLSNWAEISIHQTHPLNGDTDGDGLSDGWEVLHGLDPNDPTGDNGANGDPD